jgi:hypothetical protein
MTTFLNIDPAFLTTRETFPGERSFTELADGFFSGASAIDRARRVAGLLATHDLVVHMANPEQIDDLFAHIDREKKVRHLSTTYLHQEIRSTVYAIGRGTGLLLDAGKTLIEHISVNDSDTVTDGRGNLVASDHARVQTMGELHAILSKQPRDDWNEVNVSFEGPGPILGLFALDGVMSKLYGAALYLKAGRHLPLFTYNRQQNRLAEFLPTHEAVAQLIEELPNPALQGRYHHLLGML